jgi:hypothetical protein
MKIKKAEVTEYGCVLSLQNDVDIHISSNTGYVYISFSGEKNSIKVKQTSANTLEVEYEAYE